MDVTGLSQVSNTSFTNKHETKDVSQKTPEQKKNGKKLLAAGAAAAASVAVAALAIKKGKLPKATQVADLKFNKGIAMKGDELFTGVAEHVNKKGDKFLLEYEDGVLLKSSKNINPKTGAGSLEKGNFVKKYSRYDGKQKVRITQETVDGVQRSTCEVSKDKVVKVNPNGEVDVFSFDDGKMLSQELSDGTKRGWYANGQMYSEVLPDGTKRGWHENGQMSYENLPDGTDRQWYENGQMSYENLPDRTQRQWYGNGQMSYEILPDGTKREWYENGQMNYEILPDGTQREWHEDGRLVD